MEELLPQGIAYCLRRGSGAAVITKGTRRYAGRRVVVLADDGGDRPGDSPSELWIAASGPARPLREIQTGPPNPGKPRVPDPRCDSESTTKASDIRISRYDQPLHITPPSKALDLTELVGAPA